MRAHKREAAGVAGAGLGAVLEAVGVSHPVVVAVLFCAGVAPAVLKVWARAGGASGVWLFVRTGHDGGRPVAHVESRRR